ncbi:hypothetical protein SAMN05421820_101845 [Pedobacter steynii]|uniref:Uncharacterized protein n=1 Tax=Pedobacter steynii TaxID=430522 RepID=A0A1G9LCD7_9SPHI|nr:DUF6266 family protein [Pedobacter steynii]NQX38810.1 hypothetical protein [Pedobacter steynii]SDL59642.1 hypothetical protein SAMN05421820_101845 [Pedobacter steynii]
MAKITGGIFGNISGKIGGLVFSTRNNQTEVRSLPKKYEGPVTEAALSTRAKLKLVAGFLRLFTFFIRIGYPKKPKQRMSAFNVAFSKNYRWIISGAYPNLEIDYPKVTLSKGNLDGLKGLMVHQVDHQLFNLRWNSSVESYQSPAPDCCDRIYCILYDPIGKQVVEVAAGAMRSDNYFLFYLPENMVGKKIHLYLFLRSSWKKEVSRTQYRCLDLREPDTNEKERNFISCCKTIPCEGAKAKKESLGKVTKHLVIPKAVVPKNKSGKIGRSVRNYTRNVLNEGIGSRRKPTRQKKP